jgi:glycopeptide antibiotics resistance protein
MIDKKSSISIILFSILFILLLTLFPFNFLLKEIFTSPAYHPLALGCAREGYWGILQNVVLFLPLGFGLSSALMQTRTLNGLSILKQILFVSFGFSYSIEMLQVLLPSRFPSLTDVFSNSVGGLLGFICFYLWKYKSVHLIWDYKNVQINILGYIILAVLVSIPLQLQTSLQNWDKTFPLLLGNERTGDRPWQGYISEVYVTDRALSSAEVTRVFSAKSPFATRGDSLLAFYRLTGQGRYEDTKGRLPALVWRGGSPDWQQNAGVLLGPKQWLETTTPATYLTQRLIQTSQFTLGVTAATHDTQQDGPARIVSLSGDSSRRNFTLGQVGKDLEFRLRTPLTEENGAAPPLRVPGVFATTKPVHLVVTYDGSHLLLYMNSVRLAHGLELTPGAAAVGCFLSLDASRMSTYKILYYAMFFMPIGLLLSPSVTRLRSRCSIQLLVISAHILFPPIMLESLLVRVSGRDFTWENLILSMIFTVGPLVLFTRIKRTQVTPHSSLK